MPHRSDKRDALTLSAYLTGLEIEFVDGPNGSDVSEKAYPPVSMKHVDSDFADSFRTGLLAQMSL